MSMIHSCLMIPRSVQVDCPKDIRILRSKDLDNCAPHLLPAPEFARLIYGAL
jgi:hypothetical protein